jgi:hypothetical protein
MKLLTNVREFLEFDTISENKLSKTYPNFEVSDLRKHMKFKSYFVSKV